MKTWGFDEMPKGFYCASVSENNGRWTFMAQPNRGDYCVEGVFENEADAMKVASDFITGVESELTKRLYSAAY